MRVETGVLTAESGESSGFLPVAPCRSILQPFGDRWKDLAAEADGLLSHEWIDHPDRHLTSQGWQIAPVRYFGADHPNSNQEVPLLTELVSRDHRIKGAAYYSLAPGTDLAPHRGNPVGLARFHLGLSVPESCGIRVGSTTKRWAEGEWLGFDDSLPHCAWNHSDRLRLVLIIDVEHPAVPVPAGAIFFRWASRTFYVAMRELPWLRVFLGRVNGLSRVGQQLSEMADELRRKNRR